LDRWIQFYPQLQGIFLDEQSSGEEEIPYYAAVRDAIRMRMGEKALIVTNPGTLCHARYVTERVTDVACIFEHHTGFDPFHRPQSAEKTPAARFAALPYQVGTAEKMQEYVAKGVREGLGYFYVTDDGGSNPWDRLPSYWAQEVEEVAKVNAPGAK